MPRALPLVNTVNCKLLCYKFNLEHSTYKRDDMAFLYHIFLFQNPNVVLEWFSQVKDYYDSSLHLLSPSSGQELSFWHLSCISQHPQQHHQGHSPTPQ